MVLKVTRLPPSPPQPTPAHPYAQLDWLGKQYARRYDKEGTRKNFLRVIALLKKYYEETDGYDERLKTDPLFYLLEHVDPFILHNLDHYLREKGLASLTVAGSVRVVCRLFNYASAKGYTPVTVFPLTMKEGTRETKQREAYEDSELNFIRKLVNEEVLYATRIVAGYKPQGIGTDPRVGRGGVKSLSGGWKHWPNIVWYFEHALDSKPFVAREGNIRQHKSFCNAAQYHGGLAKIWRRLGVTPLVGSKVVAPLVMKLAWETGLNPESVLSLKRDCFRDSHELTGKAYLSYFKGRSTGDKQLHLALLDTKNPRRQEADLQMMPKQSAVIRRTIDLIKEVTEPLLPYAEEEDRQFLFLFQPLHAKQSLVSTAVRIKTDRVASWAASVSDSVAMTEAGPFTINLARFRPTKITQMVRDGYDFFHIQAVAGHAQAKTTAHYLARHQLNPQAQREISRTLARIHENRVEIDRVPKPYANAETPANDGVIFKGIMCDCKDVLDPPDWVKRLPHFRPGRACTFWNMCLLCPNVLITRKHLPLLVSYAKEIEVALQHNNLLQAPNGAQYQKMKSLLDRIFNEEFDEETVAWAREVAENADYYLDAVTYRGVEHQDTHGAIQKSSGETVAS